MTDPPSLPDAARGRVAVAALLGRRHPDDVKRCPAHARPFWARAQLDRRIEYNRGYRARPRPTLARRAGRVPDLDLRGRSLRHTAGLQPDGYLTERAGEDHAESRSTSFDPATLDLLGLTRGPRGPRGDDVVPRRSRVDPSPSARPSRLPFSTDSPRQGPAGAPQRNNFSCRHRAVHHVSASGRRPGEAARRARQLA